MIQIQRCHLLFQQVISINTFFLSLLLILQITGMEEDSSPGQNHDPGKQAEEDLPPGGDPSLVEEREDMTASEELPKEMMALISEFEKGMSTEDSNLSSTMPHIQNILCKVSRSVFESLEILLGQNNSWPGQKIEALLAKECFEIPTKGLNKVAQQHLLDCSAKILPLFKEVLLKEASRWALLDGKNWEDSLKMQEMQEKEDKIVAELAQEKKRVLAANEEADEAKKAAEEAVQKAGEMEKNASHMITDHRRLTQEVEEKTKQVEKQAKLIEGYKGEDAELESYKAKEKDYGAAMANKEKELEAMKLKNGQLVEGNEIHLRTIQKLEARNQELLDTNKELLEKNQQLEGQTWQTAGGKAKTFAAAVSPPSSPRREEEVTAAAGGGTTTRATAPPPATAPARGSSPVSTPTPAQAPASAMVKSVTQGRQTNSAILPAQVKSDGIFSTFYVADFAAFVSQNSLDFSKNYLKRIADLKTSIYADVKAAFATEWASIEPVSNNLVPGTSMDDKVKSFKDILRDICIARVPEDFRLRMEHLKAGNGFPAAPSSKSFFLLPGLIPGRKDFTSIYNRTIQCANRSDVQVLLALYVPQLWRNMALMEHYSDNMAARTKFVYAPRSGSSQFEVALNLICVFLAEEVVSFERHWNGLGPCQTADRPMFPDSETFDQEQVDKICRLKNTPNCMRRLLSSSNQSAAFHLAYKEEKIKFRNFLNPNKEKTQKRKNMDDGHLFD